MPSDIDRRRQMLRLSAAAALQTFAGLRPVDAWNVSAVLPESIQIELRTAAAIGIAEIARGEVRRIYSEWRQTRTAALPQPYPAFAEHLNSGRPPCT